MIRRTESDTSNSKDQKVLKFQCAIQFRKHIENPQKTNEF